MINKYIIFQLPGWAEKDVSPAALATEAAQPYDLIPATLIQLFQEAVALGADPAEMAKLWSYNNYIDWAEDSLAAGNLANMQALIATMPGSLEADTIVAIAAAITARTRAAYVALWPEGETPPESISAADVTEALTDAGYTWSGSAWSRT